MGANMSFGAQSSRCQKIGGSAAVAQFPRRPNGGVLSESIPLFFIGRNASGFWVAREAQGRVGGVFLFRRSAVRFANRNSAPAGCAVMALNERLELDVKNDGNPLTAWLIGIVSRMSDLIPKYPPPLTLGRQKLQKGEWR
jgi:hypothetical protein